MIFLTMLFVNDKKMKMIEKIFSYKFLFLKFEIFSNDERKKEK